MKKSLYLILTVLMFSSALVFAKEPANLAVCKQQVVKYHDSGEYENDLNRVAQQALKHLKTRLASDHFKDKKPALVLDIDETSLSNYSNIVKMGFGGTLEQIRAAEDEGNDVAIKPTLELYQYARQHGVAIIFISGRLENERGVTVKNLQQAGYTNWDKLILRSDEQKTLPAAQYKTAIRKKLTEENYLILENIGDQNSDLAGGYAEKTYKLPNPFYFIP